MRFFTTLILVLAFYVSLFCQDHTYRLHKIDSLREQLRHDSAHIFRFTPWKAYLRVENRRTFVNKEAISLVGGMAGVIYREKHIFCAGYYFLNPASSSNTIHIVEDNRFLQQHLRQIEYFNLSYQYILFNLRYFQLNLPLEIGYGRYHISVQDSHFVRIRRIEGDIIPIGAGAQLIFKPVRWAGISFSGGYRYIKEEEVRRLKLNFKGWYYTLGVWVDARHIYRMAKYSSKKRCYRQQLRAIG